MSDAPFLIAGGGIAGLAAALALAQRGRPSDVMERRLAFAEAGAGIQLGPNATRVVTALGLKDALTPLIGQPDAVIVRRAGDGRELNRLPLGDWIARRHGSPYWTLHRADLHATLLARAQAAPLITITMGVEAPVTPPDDRTLLVEASGVWGRPSAADHHMVPWPRRQRAATGFMAARAVIARDAVPAVLAGNAVGLWLAPAAHVVHYPVRGGTEMALVAIFRGAGGDGDEPPSSRTILTALPKLCPVLTDLLAAGQNWRTWPLRDYPSSPHVAGPSHVRIGDCAHPMLPYLAQGGAMALEDALSLASHLESESSTAAALSAFAQDRGARVARVVRQSRANGTIYHAGGLTARARDAVLRSVPGKMLITRYDWLYGWAPGV